MNRRISKSNTNYHLQRYYADHFMKKQSFNEQDWRFATSDTAAAKTAEAHSLSLYFQNPHVLLNCRRLQHYSSTQRLREGIYILLRGRIRVLLVNPSRNSSKVDVQHAINRMENSPKLKCTSNKLNIIEVSQAYQVINCTSNCLAIANTDCWYISPQELVNQRYTENFTKLTSILNLNAKVFSVSLQLPFIFKLISLSFRNRIELIDQIQLAIIKKGSVRVQWRAKPCQQLIIAEGSVIIKSNEYLYSCQSSEAELIGITANKTFKYLQDPLWTKRPEASPPVLPKQHDNNQRLLFRSRSINLQRLTAQSGSRAKSQKSYSVQKDSNTSRLLTLQSASSTPNYREIIKQNWMFMRKVESYQVASNTRSQIQYQRLEAIRLRFKKEKQKTAQIQSHNQIQLAKKQPRGKVKFIKIIAKQDNQEGPHLFHSVDNFFKNQLSLHK